MIQLRKSSVGSNDISDPGSAGRHRFEIIDFLKGYAIFTIMAFHFLAFAKFPPPWDSLIWFGGTGIHLFILLSGFGLYFSFLKKPLTWWPFIQKRAIKIYIPYILVVLISALIAIFIPVYENSWYALGGHIMLYKMFDEQIIGSYGYQFWFLSMIIQFYLLFPLFAILKQRIRDIPFVLIALAISLSWSLLVIALGKEYQRVWNSFFLQYLWEFALGMVMAERLLGKTRKGIPELNGTYFLAMGIVNCLIYAFLSLMGGQTGKMLNDVFALAGYSFIAIWFYRLGLRPVNRFLIFVGRISLSVFLWHMLIINLLPVLFPGLNKWVVIPLAFGSTLTVAYFYQWILDRLFNRMLPKE